MPWWFFCSCLGGVSGGVSVILGGVLAVPWWYLGGVSLVSRWSLWVVFERFQ